MSELLIRPSRNDHKVVQDLLAPGGAAILLPGSRPLIDRLVVDATLVRSEYADAAANAGVAVLVDPLTPLWQDEVEPDGTWARLPFGRADKLSAADLVNPFWREELIEQVVEFQLEHGATAIIPPYLYASSPTDAYFDATIDLLAATASYLRRNGISMPVFPILCAKHQAFAKPHSWSAGLDRFTNAALDVGPEALGICLTPVGDQKDSYSKVVDLFEAMRHLKDTGARVIPWRQGVYGPGLVAAGMDGYETGIGVGEKVDVVSYLRNRRPAKPGAVASGRGSRRPIYLEPFHRSLTHDVAETLLGDRGMRARIMCDHERCCPNGVSSTLDHHREHAVRTRARELAAIEGLPHSSWRLHHIATNARASATLAAQANQVLLREGVKKTVSDSGYNALAQTADYIRDREARAA